MADLQLVTQLCRLDGTENDTLNEIKSSLDASPLCQSFSYTDVVTGELNHMDPAIPVIFQALLPALPRLPVRLRAWIAEEIIATGLGKAPLTFEQKTVRA